MASERSGGAGGAALERLGRSDLLISTLCLGGNVFGWSAGEVESFAVLDSFFVAGGNFIDTADSYSAWVPGHAGGESERLIGRWMASRGNRDRVVLATKVGRKPGRKRLRAATILQAVDESLVRLGTDHIDLYYAHGDDDLTIPLGETLAAFDQLVRIGKVRYIAASNYGPRRLAKAVALSRREGLAEFVALQANYSLMERGYERELAPLCAELGLPCLPYYALAQGFLAGKYRPDQVVPSGPRSQVAAAYLDARGRLVLAALDRVAASHGSSQAAIALAWLRAQATVAAPIASARTPEQLRQLLAPVELTPDEVEALSAASS